MALIPRELLAARLREAVGLPPGDHRDAAIAAVLAGQHPADVAAALRGLDLDDAFAVFGCLKNGQASEALDELDEDLTRDLIDRAPPGLIAALLDRLPMDDAAEVVAEASPDRSGRLLTELADRAPADADEVRLLLAYPEHAAGRLMTDKFAAVAADLSVGRVFDLLRAEADTLEMVHVVYVLDAGRRLLGACPMRRLLTAAPGQPVGEVMLTVPATVAPDTDQQEVARAISRYDLTAIPVVDGAVRMLGIVTVDDVIDVLVEEFNEDYLRLVGSDAEEMHRRRPFEIAKLRLPWLLGTMLIELGAGAVISHFDDVLKQVILLASFMPVISAISGNIGLQAAAIVVRGLDTGHVSLARWGRQVGKELATALLLAVICGAALGGVAVAWSGRAGFGAVIGVALTCSMLTAGFMGTVIPMLSKRLGMDPATTAGPFETAFQDVIGFAVFLSLASQLLQWLT